MKIQPTKPHPIPVFKRFRKTLQERFNNDRTKTSTSTGMFRTSYAFKGSAG